MAVEPEELVTPFYIGPIGDGAGAPGSVGRVRYEKAVLAYEHIVRRACEEAGVNPPVRADMIYEAGEIPEQVFRHLRDDPVVIADLTEGNPNVMYELGMRHTLNKLTIQISERGKRPFNVSVIRTIEFQHQPGSYIDAKNAVLKQLEQGLLGKFHPVTATRVWNEARKGGVPPNVVDGDDEEAGEGDDLEASDGRPQVGDPDYEGPYWLEAWSEAQEALPNVVIAMEDIGHVMQDFTSAAAQGSKELQEVDRQGTGTKGKLLTAIRFAERLDEPLGRLDEIAARFLTETTRVEPAILMLMDRAERRELDFSDPEEVQGYCGLFSAMVGIKPTMQEFRSSAVTARGQVLPLRALAKPVAVRINRLVAGIDVIVKAAERFIAWSTRADSLISVVCIDKPIGSGIEAELNDSNDLA